MKKELDEIKKKEIKENLKIYKNIRDSSSYKIIY
jgi:hypothetical protein